MLFRFINYRASQCQYDSLFEEIITRIEQQGKMVYADDGDDDGNNLRTNFSWQTLKREFKFKFSFININNPIDITITIIIIIYYQQQQ